MDISDVLKKSLFQETNPDAGPQNAKNHAAALKAGNEATPSVNPKGGGVSQPSGTPCCMFNSKSQASGTTKQSPATKGSYAAAVNATSGNDGSRGVLGLASIGPKMKMNGGCDGGMKGSAVTEALAAGVGTIALIRSNRASHANN